MAKDVFSNRGFWEFPDAVYAVQPLTYAANLTEIFREVFRVLKPGGRCSYLDGVMKDQFDDSKSGHLRLLHETRQVTGLGGFWYQGVDGGFWTSAMEAAGFEVLGNYDMSEVHATAPTHALLSALWALHPPKAAPGSCPGRPRHPWRARRVVFRDPSSGRSWPPSAGSASSFLGSIGWGSCRGT